jgi:hypothetical protein
VCSASRLLPSPGELDGSQSSRANHHQFEAAGAEGDLVMCDGEADDVDSICELYAAEAHRSAPLRTTISVNLREQLRGAGTARRLFEDSAPRGFEADAQVAK